MNFLGIKLIRDIYLEFVTFPYGDLFQNESRRMPDMFRRPKEIRFIVKATSL